MNLQILQENQEQLDQDSQEQDGADVASLLSRKKNRKISLIKSKIIIPDRGSKVMN